MSLFRLVLLTARRAPLRPLALVALVSVASLVFIVVSDLSRVAREGLSNALDAENGAVGSFVVHFDESLGLTLAEERMLLKAVAAELSLSQGETWEEFSPLTSECPPFERVGEVSMVVAWDAARVAANRPFGELDGVDTQWCIAGQTIPDSALYVVGEGIDQGRLFIRPDYQEVLTLASVDPIYRSHQLTASSRDVTVDVIREASFGHVSATAQILGLSPVQAVMVAQANDQAELVRAAADGVGLVYDIIRWGVVVLAGIAVLTLQLIATQHRAWFYGLARSFGVSLTRVVMALLLEVTGIVLLGAVVAYVVLLLAQGSIVSFAHSTLGVQADPLNPASLVGAALGLAAITGLAAGASAFSVSRRDPLAVLEAPRD